MGQKILTIDILEPDRDFIAISGKPYYLRSDEELSLTQIARIRRLSRDIKAKGLEFDAPGAEVDLEGIEAYIDQVLDVVLIGLEPELRGKLNTVQKFMIARAFLTASSARRAKVEAEEKKQAPSTSGYSSPGSSGSTEAAPATG